MRIAFKIILIVSCAMLTNCCSICEKQHGMGVDKLEAKSILLNENADIDQREQAIQKLRNLNDWRTLLESVPTIMQHQGLVMQVLEAVEEIGDPDAKDGVLRVERLYLESNIEPSGQFINTLSRVVRKFESSK